MTAVCWLSYNARLVIWKRHGLILLILLLAFGLRLASLTEFPPGLTHDEANHGREAIGILDGILLFYFPLNYGSEPLYSYTAAGSMALLGESLFALRWVNVVFGLLAISLTYTWAGRAFDRRIALLAAALTAVSFWPLATSRQALRAGMLPFFMLTAVWFYWRLLAAGQMFPFTWRRILWPAAGFGVCVAVTLHIYLAARVAWLLFPLFLLYLWLWRRELFRHMWRPTLAGLLLAGLLVTPMFLYLARYPYALTRLDMLDGPLQALQAGDILPLVRNGTAAWLAFFWPGYGDQFLAYNIPGRPVFDGVTAVFFCLGFLAALWRWRRLNTAFLLLWFGVGILPSLITGPTANTTRNLAALPAAFLFPAIGFEAAAAALERRLGRVARPLAAGGLVLWLLFAGITAVADYFGRWGSSAAVRGAYQVNLMRALAYVAEHPSGPPLLLSSVYPGPAHDPSIDLVVTGQRHRWVDARYALVLPGAGDGRAIIPTSTPPHPALAAFLDPLETISLRAGDLDPAFTVYALDAAPLAQWDLGTAVNVNDALVLRYAGWLETAVSPDQTAELLTIWQITDPARAGPVVPPAFTTDLVLFTQLLDQSGQVWTQHDSLEAPSWSWQAGDMVLQIHPLSIPSDAAPGAYAAITGWYERASGRRLPVLNAAGEPVDDKIEAPPLQINSP